MKEVLSIYDEIRTALETNKNAEIAKGMSQYMRNQFACFGIPSPQRKSIFKDFKVQIKALNEKQLQVLVNKLWNDPERESQYFAMLSMELHVKKISSQFLLFGESLITTKSWWDTVDWLAPNLFGTAFKNFPDERNKYVFDWIECPNIWLNRSALIFQLKYRDNTDFNLMTDFILRMSGNNEFFIQKACGWALRQYSKYNKNGVVDFIKAHPELSSLAKKEGLKWLKNKGLV